MLLFITDCPANITGQRPDSLTVNTSLQGKVLRINPKVLVQASDRISRQSTANTTSGKSPTKGPGKKYLAATTLLLVP
jgi:hypothetical protein